MLVNRRERRKVLGRARASGTVAVAAAVTVALALASCSGGSAGDAAGSGKCAGPGVSKDGIRLGLLYPSTGSASSTFEGDRAGVDARIGMENARGGINGRKISYVWQDDQGTPAGNATLARQLVGQQDVFGIVETSTAEEGSAKELSQQGVPVVGLGSSTAWSRYPNMFTYLQLISDTAVSSAWGEIARAHGGTRAAVLGLALSTSAQQLSQALATSMNSAGIPTVYQNMQIDQTVSMDSLAAQIVRSGADTVTGLIPVELWSGLKTALRRAGANSGSRFCRRATSAGNSRSSVRRWRGPTSASSTHRSR